MAMSTSYLLDLTDFAPIPRSAFLTTSDDVVLLDPPPIGGTK